MKRGGDRDARAPKPRRRRTNQIRRARARNARETLRRARNQGRDRRGDARPAGDANEARPREHGNAAGPRGDARRASRAGGSGCRRRRGRDRARAARGGGRERDSPRRGRTRRRRTNRDRQCAFIRPDDGPAPDSDCFATRSNFAVTTGRNGPPRSETSTTSVQPESDRSFQVRRTVRFSPSARSSPRKTIAPLSEAPESRTIPGKRLWTESRR